ncbi:hypothetical protein WJX73_010523 [Symbiochloris irregularis]|uniref:F-box domain-containing protein n=1 Tax=Symbiochloris irregularis TaxID=706552 RepID=A0AAW1NT15_9CHLO
MSLWVQELKQGRDLSRRPHQMGLPHVARILHHLLFPLLDASALAALACTSTELRAAVYETSPAIWEAAARRSLPQPHPLQQPATRSSIQAALQAYAHATRTVKAGTATHKHLNHASKASFNATASHLAVFHKGDVKIFETESITSFEGFQDPVVQIPVEKFGQ